MSYAIISVVKMSTSDQAITQRSGQLDAFIDVIGLTPRAPLITFSEMWWQIFLWVLFSSMLVHSIAAIIAFTTLRKHHYGKFFPVLIAILGGISVLTSGVLSSAAIAFVYRASSLQMLPLYAMFWGVGQTLLAAAVGFTRVLATL